MKRFKIFAIIISIAALTACQQDYPQQAAAPAEQVVGGVSPLGAGVVGAGLGYLAGKRAGRNQAAAAAPPVQHVTVNNYHPPRRTVYKNYGGSRRSYGRRR